MIEINQVSLEQLRQACKLSGARWGVWLTKAENDWDYAVQIGLGKARQAMLAEFLRQPETAAWLAGAFSSGRTRSRSTGEFINSLAAKRIFLFANSATQSAIMIGADDLTKNEQAYLRILSLNNPLVEKPRASGMDMNIFEQFAGPVEDREYELSSNPQSIYRWILDKVAQSATCEAAYLAIRVGEVFRIEQVWQYPNSVVGTEIPVLDQNLIAMVEGRKPIFEKLPVEMPEFALADSLSIPIIAYLGLPVVIGRRVIGMILLVSSNAAGFKAQDAEIPVAFLERVAHAVENAIVFSDVARYLQQFALLSELATDVSGSVDSHEVARRVVRRLRRTFRTDMVAIFMLSSGNKMLMEYGGEPRDIPIMIPVETSLIGYVAETNDRVRVGDIWQAPRFLAERHQISSFLGVPINFRGKVIGVIAVESVETNAFNHQDEQMLVVIASYLAGLLENVRLIQETRERARNLDLIHKVVEHIVGLTDISEIGQSAAELIAEYFRYEFAIVLLPDKKGINLVNIGVGGTMAHLLKRGRTLPINQGITGLAFRKGERYLSNDVSKDPYYLSLPGWQAGSELCVPLKEGDRVLGVINLERAQKYTFLEGDIVIIESLAGILASVITNAQHYSELQSRIKHLHAVRETALDISGNLDSQTLFNRVVHRARELVRAKGALLVLLDEDRKAARVVVAETSRPGLQGKVLPLNSGVTGMVVTSGAPFQVADYSSWEGIIEFEDVTGMSAVAGVPLKWQDQVIGILMVTDDQPGRLFFDEDIQILELLAPQIAVSLRNARLYQDLRESMESQQLAERQLLITARLAALGEMAAGVAHELNNPLTTVTGFVELALDELPEDLPQREELSLVLSEAQRARGVVRRLLDFARQGENLRTSTDVNDLISTVMSLMQHQAQSAGVQMRLEVWNDLPPIMIDANQIKQVLVNLIQNAIQAMPHGGNLVLSTACNVINDEKWITISVIDTGEGIPPENLERVFDPFFTTRPLGKGTGLGLSVSYGLISDHGGYIDLASEVGVGSNFKVWLPVEQFAIENHA